MKWFERSAVRYGGLLLGIFLYTFRHTIPAYFPGHITGDKFFYASGLGSALIIAFILNSESAQRFLMAPMLRIVGRTSYSIYLFHFIVLLCLAPQVLNLANGAGITEPTICWWIGLAATTAFVLILAAVMYRWVENPSIRLGRWITRMRYFQRVARYV